MESHLTHLSLLSHTLAKGKLYLKVSKCLATQETNEYLGLIICFDEAAHEKNKIEATLNSLCPTPTNNYEGS